MFGINQNEIVLFLLVFARISAALAVFPILGSNSVPLYTKIGLGLFLSFLIMPVVANTTLPQHLATAVIIFNVGKEVIVGLLMGFISTLLFAGIEIAGTLAGMQMGFGIVNVIDPQTQRQVSIISQFQILMVSMIFLIIDGHHFLLSGLNQSFEAIPPMAAHFRSVIFDINMKMTANIFVAAIKVGAPVIVALLLTSFALGLIARAVPQMNVFIVGLPLKVAIGLMALAFSLPFVTRLFEKMFIQFRVDFFTLIRAMSP
ncbi:MAG: flagellar biosynthetic protein FliR [Calditrichaeota bacterium]|nr:flagellar biosynthetic protein FliR [Calditrichota bacterium]